MPNLPSFTAKWPEILLLTGVGTALILYLQKLRIKRRGPSSTFPRITLPRAIGVAFLISVLTELKDSPEYRRKYDVYIVLLMIAVFSVSELLNWFAGVRARRKLERDLGRKVSALDLTSLKAWMQAEDTERRKPIQ
jgi:hypothetical protein